MSLFSYITSKRHRLQVRTQKRLEDHSKPTFNFFFLTALSSALAALGLLLNNASIIIGAMVVAPLTTPMFDLALSTIVVRGKRMFLSLIASAVGAMFAVITGAIIGYMNVFFDGRAPEINAEIASRLEPSVLFFLVAFLSGVAGAYAYSRPKVPEAITGIAISVAVIPPLSVAGLGIVMQSSFVTMQSLLLYVFNFFGIVLGSILTFIVVGMQREKNNGGKK